MTAPREKRKVSIFMVEAVLGAGLACILFALVTLLMYALGPK